MPDKTRCPWVGTDPLYLDYHDTEWGVPLHDDRQLFELLILEGAQAGLSWLTILRKRENYRAAFEGFDPVVVAGFDAHKLELLMANPGIVRNRLKIKAAVGNARSTLEVQREFGSLDAYLWSFVGGKTLTNHWEQLDQLPAKTPESAALSADLKRRGFKFVGPTICYAFMQSAGLVNDHLVSCFRHAEVG